MTLLINSIAHFLVDALCAATLFGSVSEEGGLTAALLTYNTLAFTTQCVVGLIADRVKCHRECAAASMLLVILGFILPLPAMLKVAFIGLGNSVFHVSGGCMTLLESGGRAGKLGVFVAPGSVGLVLGTLYPRLGTLFALGLLLCAALISLAKPVSIAERPKQSEGGAKILVPLLLTCAVAVRAVGGTVVSFPWKTGEGLTIALTLFVFAGKALGGFVCDRLGARVTALVSIPLAAVLIAFFTGFMAPSMLGQLLLNLTMPVTLWLMYRAMPDAPGFSFGLAASALWPGTIAGILLKLTGPALWLCVIICFAFGLFAILFSCRRLKMKKEREEQTI